MTEPTPPAAIQQCPGANPDVSAKNGWQSSDAMLPASGALRFEVKARPAAANLDGLVALGAESIDNFDKAAVTVRFADNGLVDVRDGDIYSSDIDYAYDPDVWYSIGISADIDAETYDVEIGPCGEPRETLVKSASFRRDSRALGWLRSWAVWSSQSAPLEISTPAWMPSGGCIPSTCGSLGQECGQPSDGCGGSLSCGGCNSGELCESGTCVQEPASALPPPACEPATCESLGKECGFESDRCGGLLSCGQCSTGQTCTEGACIATPVTPPSCVPDTCQSLGRQCGASADGCGGYLSCGGCGNDQTCTAGICVDDQVTPPPPPPCVPDTCQALGIECGAAGNGCGGTLSCGGCSSGEMCSSGTCIDAPGSSSDWWATVPKPNATNTGPNCAAPGCPSATLQASNAPPLVVTQDGATYENFRMTLAQYDEIRIRARNVTFRNFYIQGNSWNTVQVENTANANFVMEYGEIRGGSPCSQLVQGDGITVQYSKFHNCDDIWKINDDSGSNGPVTIENSYFYGVLGGHGDTFMIWPNMDNDTTARHNHFVGGNTSIVIDASISPGATLLFEQNWLHGGGAAYTIYCDTREGGTRIYRDNLFDRDYMYGPAADPGCTWFGNAYMDDGSSVPYTP